MDLWVCRRGRASTWRRGPRCWTEPREVASRLPVNTQIVFDDAGRLHFAALEPEPEPASLLELRAAVNAMPPGVDLPEVLLEVFSWTGADQAFTSVTGGEARLRDCTTRSPRCWSRTAAMLSATPGDRRPGRAEVRPALPRRPDLPATGDLSARERRPDRHLGVNPARAGVGRRPGRLGGWDALRRSGATGVRAAEPEVLRASGDLAQHDQRPGCRARRAGGGWAPRTTLCTSWTCSTTATAAAAPR